MLRSVSLAVALSLVVACGGEIDPSSTGKDSDSLAGGRAKGSPPSTPSEPTQPGEPTHPTPAPDDLTGFVECSGANSQLQSKDAKLEATGSDASGSGLAIGTVRHRVGKYSFEVAVGEIGGSVRIGLDGILNGATSRCSISNDQNLACSFASADGMSGGGSGGGPTDGPIRSGDFVGVAVDLDEQTMHFTLNGEHLADESFSFLSDQPGLLMAPMVDLVNTDVHVAFGAAQYPAPAGYLPWDCIP